MDPVEPAHDENQQENTSKYNHTYGDNKKFYIELTVSQSYALDKILPKGYSLQVERQVKNRRNNLKKKANTIKKQAINNVLEIQQPSQRISKTKSAQRYNQDMANLSNYSRAASQSYYQQIDDFMKPCLRILHMLKNHKTSWPFKEPVDPIHLNIPNYLEIIKQPMDLQTVQKNLKSRVYATPTQFHADIGKIIRNSYQFNKNNIDFMKLTQEFEQYYNKISTDSSTNRSNPYPQIPAQSILEQKKKKSKSSAKPSNSQPRYRDFNDTQPATLAQKKQLTIQIKKLARQFLKQVIEIVYEGKPPHSEQLNIDNLPTAKIRQLQRFVRDKGGHLQNFGHANSNSEKNEDHERNQNSRDEESSFESDSNS